MKNEVDYLDGLKSESNVIWLNDSNHIDPVNNDEESGSLKCQKAEYDEITIDEVSNNVEFKPKEKVGSNEMLGLANSSGDQEVDKRKRIRGKYSVRPTVSSSSGTSVVQTIIDLQMRKKLTYKEKLKFKSSGLPRPVMKIIHTNKCKNKEVHRYFKETMYDLSDWLCGCEVTNGFYCFVCLLFGDYSMSYRHDTLWCRNGVTDVKHIKGKVTKHSLSANHIKNSVNYAMLGRSEIRLQLDSAYRKSVQDYNENVTRNRYILNKIIDCVKFCGSFELAVRGHDQTDVSDNSGIFRGLINFVAELDSIFKTNLDENSVFKGMSKTIQNELLDSILSVVQDQIKSEIALSDFIAIQADESRDSSNQNQVVLIIRYVLDGTVHERFWKFISPQGKTAQELADVILAELKALEIDKKPEKLIAQSYDCASIISGKLGGVQTKIRNEYPEAVFVHSYAHQLNLVLEKAVSQSRVIKVFFLNLHSFSSFFGGSHKRTAVLNEVVKARSPEAVPTRWYFKTRCVKTVYLYRNDIFNCLTKMIETEEDGDTLNQAIGLQNFLEDEVFLYWLEFFHSIMPHCETLFKQLQKRNLDANAIKNYIDNFKSSMQKVKDNVSDDDQTSTSLASSRKRMRSEASNREISLQVCDIIVSEIEQRFSFNDHLILSQLFQSDNFEKYSQNFPHKIIYFVKQRFQTVNDVKLKNELQVIYERDDFRQSSGAIAILQLFTNNNLCQTFSESVKILKTLCTLPMTTVESERCVSTLKRIKTFLRNTMGQDRLSALAMLSIEKALVKNIKNFNELVIDHFANAQDRRIDLKYKSL